jgi:glycosyltransferase involved in cell wall biosynthesis
MNPMTAESKPPWAIVAGSFHRHGGMDRCNWALARHLAAAGRRVHLVCHYADRDLLDDSAITVHRVPKPANSFMLGGIILAGEGRRVAARLSLESPGARVVTNGGNCRWPDINWVHCVHHAWRLNLDRFPRWLRVKERMFRAMALRYERAALRSARLVIANSERTRRELIDYLGIAPDRIHVVYPGAPPGLSPATPERREAARNWLRVPAERPLAAFVGALGYDSNKGFDLLFAAWRKLCSRPDWDVDLVVAGGGRALDRWRGMVVESRLDDRIRLPGFSERIPDLLAAADLLISPVRYEAYGVNVQEAICSGIPAMVTATAGVAERFPAGLAELLIRDPEDADALVAMLLKWRPALPQWKERIARFSSALRADTLEAMVRKIVAAAEANPPSRTSASRPSVISHK